MLLLLVVSDWLVGVVGVIAFYFNSVVMNILYWLCLFVVDLVVVVACLFGLCCFVFACSVGALIVLRCELFWFGIAGLLCYAASFVWLVCVSVC